MKKYCTTESQIGAIIFAEEEGAITNIYRTDSLDSSKMQECKTPLLEQAMHEFEEYLLGTRQDFDFPINPKGTNYQKRVWEALRKIPYGETRNYKQVAILCGNEKASRAVGGANNKNPILVVIPCHRVIGADGSLTGYAAGLNIKEHLLKLEAKHRI